MGAHRLAWHRKTEPELRAASVQLMSGRPVSRQGPALSWESELQSGELSERKPIDLEGGEQAVENGAQSGPQNPTNNNQHS